MEKIYKSKFEEFSEEVNSDLEKIKQFEEENPKITMVRIGEKRGK